MTNVSEQEMIKLLREHGWTENRSTVSIFRFEDPHAEGSWWTLKSAYELELSRQPRTEQEQ